MIQVWTAAESAGGCRKPARPLPAVGQVFEHPGRTSTASVSWSVEYTLKHWGEAVFLSKF